MGPDLPCALWVSRPLYSPIALNSYFSLFHSCIVAAMIPHLLKGCDTYFIAVCYVLSYPVILSLAPSHCLISCLPACGHSLSSMPKKRWSPVARLLHSPL